jgi:hypothetical protein
LGRASQVGSIDGLYERIVPDVDEQCQDAELVIRSLLAQVGCLNATTVQLHARWIDAAQARQHSDEADIMFFNHEGELIDDATDRDDVDTIFGQIYDDDDDDGEGENDTNPEEEQIFFHQLADPNCSFERLAKYCATQGINLCLESSWSQTKKRYAVVEAILRFNGELIETCKTIDRMCGMEDNADGGADLLATLYKSRFVVDIYR